MEHPKEIKTSHKPVKAGGHRVLEDGSFKTSKQERVRSSTELAELNKATKEEAGQADCYRSRAS